MNNSKPFTYLASPYTHESPMVMSTRYHLISRVFYAMWRKGEHVFSPIVHMHPLSSQFLLPTDSFAYEEWNNAFLIRSDRLCVVAMDGWQQSSGVNREIQFFKRLGRQLVLLDPDTLDMEAMPDE